MGRLQDIRSSRNDAVAVSWKCPVNAGHFCVCYCTYLNLRSKPFTAWANCTGESSCRKCPPTNVWCGCPCVPGTRSCMYLSPPRVIGSPLLKVVRNGFCHCSRIFQAARLASLAGSFGVTGTSLGKSRAPALYFMLGNGAS